MYFGRLDSEHPQKRNPLPIEWLEEVTKTLNDVYRDKCDEVNRFFEVYGENYKEEFVVIVSLLHKKDQMAAPITLFLSHDVAETSKELKKILSDMVDLIGLIFDDIFDTKDWSEFNAMWTENQFRNHTYFYKVTRENISLSLQAEAILQKDIELN